MRLALRIRLARRFSRTRPIRQSVTIVLVIVVALMTLFVVLEGYSLSSEQIVERDLGRFDASLQLADTPPGNVRALTAAAAAARDAGARDVSPVLETYDIRPAAAASPLATYREGDWGAEPFPARYSLAGGRWPQRAGEAAVSSRLAEYVDATGRMPVLSGNAELQIVGRVEDRFATASALILAARGSWQALDATVLAEKYPQLVATPSLYWSAGDTEAVIDAVGRTQPRPDSAPLPRTRQSELATAQRSWVDRIPIAYRLPSILLPALAVLAVVGLNGRRLQRNLATLRAVGVRRTDATAAVMLAVSALCIAATAAGALLGAAIGIVTRPLAQLASSRPLAPVPDWVGAALRLELVVTVACATAMLAVWLAARRPPARSVRTTLLVGRLATNSRHAAATGCAAFAVWSLVSLRDFETTMIAVAACVAALSLMAPELVRCALGARASGGPRRPPPPPPKLAHPRRVSVVVALVAAALGPALAMAIVLPTSTASDAADRLSLAAPGQIVLAAADPLATPPKALVHRLVRDLPAPPPLQVYAVDSAAAHATLQGQLGSVIAVRTVADAIALSNGALRRDQRAVLGAGGMLVWQGGAPERELVLQDARTGALRSATAPVRVAAGPFQRNWEQQADALLLVATARRLDLPLTPTEQVIVGASDRMARAAEQIAQAEGYDSRRVETFAAPEPATLPPAYWAAALGLGALLLITFVTVARAQAVALRGYLAGLVAIGMPAGWTRDVLRLELATMLVLGALLGLAGGVVPLAVAARKVPGTILEIPWASIAATTVVLLGAALIAAEASSRRLRAADRRR